MRPLIRLFGQCMTPAARQFQRQLQDPETVQHYVQQQLLDRLQQCVYGRHFCVQTLADWQRLPIVDYADLEPWIQQQQQQHRSLLTPDPVLFYEQTSGSQGPAKWIPYTKALRHSFQSLFCIWAYDLIQNGPPFQTGRAYMSITPAFAAAGRSTEGLQDDSDYLDGWLQWVLSPFLVTVPGVQQIQDMETFKHHLSLALLRAETLEILSIWSPTFLLVHLDYIQAHRQSLKNHLGSQLSRYRQDLLNQDLIPWSDLWPHLKLISCWDQAHASGPAAVLRQLFPTVMVQGKGLLATEAPMTVPWIQAQGCLPLLNEVFFEFEDERGDLHRLHQLQEGKRYGVIVSQKGGLYRYRMGDQVEVTSIYQLTPCLALIGRTTKTSDLVGEKLHESFVQDILSQIPAQGSQFRCLVPRLEPHPHYVLLLDQVTGNADTMAVALDQGLQASPHYQLARQLGQLGSIKARVLPNAIDELVQSRIDAGCQWGSVKVPCLWTYTSELRLS